MKNMGKHMGMGMKKHKNALEENAMHMKMHKEKENDVLEEVGQDKDENQGKMMMGKKKRHHGPVHKGHHNQKGKSHHNNPVKYIRSVGHNIVTSLVPQTTTTLTVPTAAHNAENSDFMTVVAFLSYETASGSITCADSLGNTYTQLSVVNFNSGYVLTLFAAYGIHSLAKNTIITVTHPISQRRIIMGDEFKNIEKTDAPDQTAAAYNSVAATFVTSGMTSSTTQAKELLYGVIGVNGPATDSFKRPANWTILHDRGTNVGDGFDIRLVTLFRLVGNEGTFEVSGTLGVARLWSCITQTFKAEGGASDVDRDV